MEKAVDIATVATAVAHYVDEMDSCRVYAPKAPTRDEDVWVLQLGRPSRFNLAMFDTALQHTRKRLVVMLSCNNVNASRWLLHLEATGYPVFDHDARTYVVAKDI